MRLLNERLVHPDDFPNMTVEILEAAAVHEAILPRLATLGTSGDKSLVDQYINLPRLSQDRQTITSVV